MATLFKWTKIGLHLNLIICKPWSGSIENIHVSSHLIEIILNSDTCLFHWKFLCKLLHSLTSVKVILSLFVNSVWRALGILEMLYVRSGFVGYTLWGSLWAFWRTQFSRKFSKTFSKLSRNLYRFLSIFFSNFDKILQNSTLNTPPRNFSAKLGPKFGCSAVPLLIN